MPYNNYKILDMHCLWIYYILILRIIGTICYNLLTKICITKYLKRGFRSRICAQCTSVPFSGGCNEYCRMCTYFRPWHFKGLL